MIEAFVGFIVVGVVIGFAFLLSLGIRALHAVVLGILWGWFMVPIFGLPALSIPAAIGLSLTIHWLYGEKTKVETNDSLLTDKAQNERRRKEIAKTLLNPLLVLFAGWVVKTFWL